MQATQRIVNPGYFAAMRLRLVAGRTLSEADTPTAPPAIVVNQTFARHYLGEHPIGVRIPQAGRRAGGMRFANDQSAWEVVGVVEDMRQDTVDAPLQPEVFASFTQVVPGAITNFDPILVVRTTADPTRHVSMLRGLVREHAPTLALDSVMTMEDRVRTSLERPRLHALVLAWFSGFALLIVGVGLFGVLSLSVADRTREIGVRSALGAQTSDIVSLVLRQALWIVSIGVAAGMAMALVGVQWLSTFAAMDNNAGESLTRDRTERPCSPPGEKTVRRYFSVGSRPSRGAPVPDEPAKSRVPSGNVTSRPLALREPSIA